MNFWNLNDSDIKIEELMFYFIKIFSHSHMCDYKIYENVIDKTCFEENIFCFCIFSNKNNNSIEFYNNETLEKIYYNLNGINIIYTTMKIININSLYNWKIVKVFKNNCFSEKYINFNILDFLKNKKLKLCQPENNNEINDKTFITKINKLTCKWIINSYYPNFLKKYSFFDIKNNNYVSSFMKYMWLCIKENKNDYQIEEQKIVYYDKNNNSCPVLNKNCDKIIIILDTTTDNNILVENNTKIKTQQGDVLFFDKTISFQNYYNLKLIIINLTMTNDINESKDNESKDNESKDNESKDNESKDNESKDNESKDNESTISDLNSELEKTLDSEKTTIYTLNKCERCVVLKKYIPNYNNYKIIYCEKFMKNDIKNNTKTFAKFIVSLSEDLKNDNKDLLFPFIFEKGKYVNYNYFLNNIKSNNCYFNNEF